MVRLAPDSVMKNFKSSGTEYALAVKLTGKFKTAFPNGKPDEKTEADGAEDKTNAVAAASGASDSLKESKQETTVILVGDADMLSDGVAVRQGRNILGMPVIQVINGNLGFVQNAVDQLTGDNNLIAVRSRATLDRPFTKINELEAAANERFQSAIQRLEQKVNEAQQRLSQLQQGQKGQDQRFVLSPEEVAEIRKVREEEAKTNKELKLEKKKLRQEVVSLETKIKCINILVVPLAVAASGIAIATIKRRKTSAK